MKRITHSLKTDPVPFLDIVTGVKRCEVRWDSDRGFKVGDRLHLREFDRETRAYSGRDCFVDVLHIQAGYGLPDGLVVMSISDLIAPSNHL